MNFILDMLMLFVILTILLIFNIPDLTSNNLLLQQFFIYFIITCYYVIQKIVVAKVINKQPYDIKQIIKDSMSNAIPCLFGFILFTDLRIMDNSKDFIAKITNTGPSGDSENISVGGGLSSIFHLKLAYIVSLFIVLFTILARTFTLMFDIETYI
jgi:hypothetical protein